MLHICNPLMVDAADTKGWITGGQPGKQSETLHQKLLKKKTQVKNPSNTSQKGVPQSLI